MWIMTTRGFYSAVEKYDDRAKGTLTIRARRKADLERLIEIIPNAKMGKVWAGTDYPWRLRCTRAEWENALLIMGQEIDYSNFKDAVKRRLGVHVASVYSSLWFKLLDLEDVAPKWPTYGYGGGYGGGSYPRGGQSSSRGKGKGKRSKGKGRKPKAAAPQLQIPETTSGTAGSPTVMDNDTVTPEQMELLDRWLNNETLTDDERAVVDALLDGERELTVGELIDVREALDEMARQERAEAAMPQRQANRPAGQRRQPRSRRNPAAK